MTRALALTMPADFRAALFSIKCLIAAVLAYYLALVFQFPKPFWAVMTA